VVSADSDHHMPDHIDTFCIYDGIMAKPMVITLPVILLLLDYWPLERYSAVAAEKKGQRNEASIIGSFYEKLPLLALALLFSIITIVVQKGAMPKHVRADIWLTATNALVSYWRYIAMMIWPSGLSWSLEPKRQDANDRL